MDIKKRSTGFGAAIIIFALLLRLVTDGMATPAHARREEPASDLRLPVVALSAAKDLGTTPWLPPAGEETLPETTAAAPPETTPPLRISWEETQTLRLRTASDCGYYPNLAPLLEQPLSWNLCATAPTVLIYHSHGCESYAKQPHQDYQEQTDRRTTALEYNMVAVGDALTALLEAAGIEVIHDRQLHDEMSYTAAYTNSRRSVEAYLQAYPTIQLVLDLHRDAAIEANGTHYATSAMVDGQPAAQLMLVVGTDYAGGSHPNWQENLALALKMQAVLEKTCPGITRTTTLRGSRFNQDLVPGALLIEVGASGNTLEEALRAVPVLAQAIIALQHGANY